MPDFGPRQYTNHDGGYEVCQHMGCSKKADWAITDHGCCGRCSKGRTCRNDAAHNYAGPGTFAHRYFPTWVSGDACSVCDQPREAHV